MSTKFLNQVQKLAERVGFEPTNLASNRAHSTTLLVQLNSPTLVHLAHFGGVR